MHNAAGKLSSEWKRPLHYGRPSHVRLFGGTARTAATVVRGTRVSPTRTSLSPLTPQLQLEERVSFPFKAEIIGPPDMSLVVSPIVVGDLLACARVHKLALDGEDDFTRLLTPARLANPSITMEDRVRDLARKLEREMLVRGDNVFGHKVTVDGEVVAYAQWALPAEAVAITTQGPPPPPPNTTAAELPMASERDEQALARFRALKGQVLAKHGRPDFR